MVEEPSIEELEAKVKLASALIQKLRHDEDPKAPVVIEELMRQQREVNRRLVKRIREERAARGEAEPPVVRVGLKSVKLASKLGGDNG